MGAVVLSGAVLLACADGPDFIKTSRDFVAAPRRDAPGLFLDKLPIRQYRAVGIIQAQGELRDVLDQVKEKGQELGCDVIVDRRIHPVSAITVRVLARIATEAEKPSDTPSLTRSSSRDSRALLGVGSLYRSAPYQPSSGLVVSQRPVPTLEFICGIYVEEGSANPSHTRAATPPSTALWDLVAEDKEGKSACRSVGKALQEESGCAGAQCLAPLVLSNVFVSRCEQADADGVANVKQQQERWKAESAESSSGACFGQLLRATRSRGAAKEYQERCIASRQPGRIEQRVLDRALSKD